MASLLEVLILFVIAPNGLQLQLLPGVGVLVEAEGGRPELLLKLLPSLALLLQQIVLLVGRMVASGAMLSEGGGGRDG